MPALLTPAHAQIRADRSASGNQQPTVLQTANGVPQVNIQTPSPQGVSRNSYSQFDVDGKGVILNNSRTSTQTQLGGMVGGNPWLATGPARIILNEVNSSDPSRLNGYVEVAGQRAEVIVANPAGIQVNGGGFINATGVTLTTGTPVMNGGNLESFRVQRGVVTIDGAGLDTSTVDYTRILARAMEVNAGLWAQDLTLVAGADEVRALASGEQAVATRIAGIGPAPVYLLDVAAIGGMYAGKIFLVGTEAGLGVNNHGTLVAQSGDWVLRADGWLVNTGRIQAKGDLTLQTTGAIDNAAGAEISSQARTTVATVDSLTNRGLIDGAATHLAAATLVNTGTGRIYGDHVAIAADTLVNDSETVQGVRADAVIAARERLDLGVDRLFNRENALVFSAGAGEDALNIGGGLDAQGHATGLASVLTNASATIESLGGLTIDAGEVNNTNEHFSLESGTAMLESRHEIQLSYDTGHLPYEQVYFYQQRYPRGSIDATLASHLARPDGQDIYANMGDCWCLVPGPFTADWNEYEYQRSTTVDRVATSAPGRLLAGGRLSVNLGATGRLTNDKSQVVAGGDLAMAGGSVSNIAAMGTQTVTDTGSTRLHTYQIGNAHGLDWWLPWTGYTPAPVVTTVTLPVTAWQSNTTPAGTGMRLPTSSLFHASPNPDSRYLVETDPRFADGRQWLGSDYMLSALSYDPSSMQKRLGDGLYEQRLIREQVAQLTGRRFLDGYANGEAEYQALMSAGVTYARAWNLVPGVGLTDEQMARLTSDIVWLVAQEVTLPDGRVTTALVPQVYLRPRAGDLAANGTLLSGQNVSIDLSGGLRNSGSIAGREVVVLNAHNVDNLAGRMDARELTVRATQDINNTGGTMSADVSLQVTAGRDLNITTTVQGGSQATGGNRYSSQGIDRVAALYATGPGATLVASAGRDVNVVAGVLASNGSVEVGAGRDVNLSTIATSVSEEVRWSSVNHRSDAVHEDVGSQIEGAGSVTLHAGHDINARAASAQAGGALVVHADHDVNMASGEQTVESTQATQSTRKNTLSSRTLTSTRDSSTTTAVASSLGGGTVDISAGQDIDIHGSEVVSDTGTTLTADGNVNLTAATNTHDSSSFQQTRQKGVIAGGGSITVGKRQQEVDTRNQGTSAAPTTVGAVSGDVTIVAGQHYMQTGSDVLAPAGDVTINAQDIDITEARERSSTTTEQRFKQSGITVSVSNPVLDAAQTAGRVAGAMGDTDNARMKALGAAAAGLGGYNAYKSLTNEAGNVDPAKASGVTVNISLGSSKSSSSTTETTDTARGSQVVAGGDVALTATGNGAGSDLHIQGSDVIAGQAATLRADGNVVLESAQNTASYSQQQSSSSASVGASFGIGPGTVGMGFNVAASQGKGSGSGHDVVQTNTHITAGNNVAITSGHDTDLQGATVAAPTVQMDVGGDLTIHSRQDTSTYQASSKSSGGSLSVSPAGVPTGGSLTAGRTQVDSDYASVNETSGILAGDGGFDVNVQGNTEISGGVIASTDAAVNSGNNYFETGGTLTTSDIENHASYDASGWSLSASYSAEQKDQQGKTIAAKPVGSAGIGTDSESASSVTTAGISGVAGNTGVRSDDGPSGIDAIFDKDRVEREVNAQITITAEFGKQASKAVGDYATKKYNELKDTDPEEAAKWAEGGMYRVLAHTVIGALTSGSAGAAGAGMASLSAEILNEMTANMPEGVRQAVGASLAAGIGAVFGGGVGGATAFNADVNNRQLHPTEAQLIKTNARRFAQALYGTSDPSAEQIQAAEAMLANTAQSMLDNNLGFLLPYSKQADDFLQQLKIEYMQSHGSLKLPGTQGQQQLFYATTEQKSQPWLNTGLADPSVTKLIVRTPMSSAINNPSNDPTRDRLTGLPLDEQGRYTLEVSVDGIPYSPKYHPCATSTCIASGQNLDLSDPGTQAYVRAVDKMILDDINRGVTVATIFFPAGAIGGLAAVLGPFTSVVSGWVAGDTSSASAKEVLQLLAVQYMTQVYGLASSTANRVAALVDLSGGWQAFVDRTRNQIQAERE